MKVEIRKIKKSLSTTSASSDWLLLFILIVNAPWDTRADLKKIQIQEFEISDMAIGDTLIFFRAKRRKVTLLGSFRIALWTDIDMSVRLHVNNKKPDNQEECELHLMPCKIQGDEPAKVSSFFEPYIRKIDDECEYCQPQNWRSLSFCTQIQLNLHVSKNYK